MLTHDYLFDASVEYETTYQWLVERDLRAADRFDDAVNKTIDMLLEWPEAGPVWPGAETWKNWNDKPLPRSYRVPGFDYRIVYVVIDSTLTIVAIASTKRHPGYWQQRLQPNPTS
ncbi:MAG: type II toxin-antitoxin system RelE/ParE family toxin [Cellulomonadaceae bacterium]|jgi:plasmid stabilization system protein ParE|nr:type II toxin-antitoxin system RelE/ParE family toxin [Cellulomonadaceae bacterium]